jgi:hypothetical protein
VADHPYVPAVNDYGEQTQACSRCGLYHPDQLPAGVRLVLPANVLPDDGRYMTVPGVAEAAGISVSAVRSHLSKGTMPAADGRFGGTVWWRPETIAVWLMSRRRRGNPAWRKGGPAPPSSRNRKREEAPP